MWKGCNPAVIYSIIIIRNMNFVKDTTIIVMGG